MKITLPSDDLFCAERFLKFFEVQLRYLQIDFLHSVNSRLVCRDISFSLCAEDIHGKGHEADYSLIRFYRTLDVVDLEVPFPHLLAVEASCERDVLYNVRCSIFYRESLDCQIEIFKLRLFRRVERKSTRLN